MAMQIVKIYLLLSMLFAGFPYSFGQEKIALKWNFFDQNDTSEWLNTVKHNLSSQTDWNALKLISSGSDPYIFAPQLNFDADKYPYIVFRMSGDSFEDAVHEIYFTTEDSPGISQDKMVSVEAVQDGNPYVYCVYMKENSNWQGKITSFRLDPFNGPNESGSSSRIYWLKLCSKPAAKLETNNSFNQAWNFKDESSRTSWGSTASHNISIIASTSKLVLQSDGSDPYILAPEADFDSQKFPYLLIKMKGTNFNGASHEVYFTTDASPNISQDKMVSVEAIQDSDSHIYCIDMSQNNFWDGKIKSFRIDPFNGPNEVGNITKIDWISFCDTTAANWDFSDSTTVTEWYGTPRNGMISIDSDESLIFKCISADPYVQAPVSSFECDDFPYVLVKMKGNNFINAKHQIYFSTQSNPSISQDKMIEISAIQDDKFHIYCFDMSSNSNWNGTIKQLRLDPFNGPNELNNSCEIEWIKVADKKAYYVKDYGATGDGQTDDTSAILSAFNSVKQTGGILDFGSGVYKFEGLKNLTGLNNMIVEATNAVLLNSVNKGGFIISNSTNLKWRGGTMRYTSQPSFNSSDQHPLYFNKCNDISAQGIHISGSPFMGMVFNGCQGVSVKDCIAENTQRDGIHFVFCQDVICNNNLLRNTVDDALPFIDLGWSECTRSKNITAQFNIIYNCRQGLVTLNSEDVLFADNHVERTVFSGCQITTNDRFGYREQNTTDNCVNGVTVTGNTFIWNGGNFNLLPGVPYDSSNPGSRGPVDSSDRTLNSGEISTGRAAIVAAYINRSGIIADGRNSFSPLKYSCSYVSANSIQVGTPLHEELITGRQLKLTGNTTGTVHGTITSVTNNGSNATVVLALQSGQLINEALEYQCCRILKDVEIKSNLILSSYVNGIYLGSAFYSDIENNNVYNCNLDRSQWTGNIIEILYSNGINFWNNNIIETDPQAHHINPYIISNSSNVSNIGND